MYIYDELMHNIPINVLITISFDDYFDNRSTTHALLYTMLKLELIR